MIVCSRDVLIAFIHMENKQDQAKNKFFVPEEIHLYWTV